MGTRNWNSGMGKCEMKIKISKMKEKVQNYLFCKVCIFSWAEGGGSPPRPAGPEILQNFETVHGNSSKILRGLLEIRDCSR